MKKKNEDFIILGSGHSIILGHLPSSVGLSKFSADCFKPKNKESINSYGLFGSEINYHTYYPEVKPEEFNPKDSEFIEPVFRMLSSVIVSKGWCPVDFSKDGVLKESMDLLVGQTVNCDHSTDIGNAIGSVKEVYWQEAYTDEKGIYIPAGINAKLKIDGKANPRIARGIMMDPPSIHSNSVTVRFLWEKSHPEMEDDDFYYKCGTYDKDGVLICKVATKILSYHETSLVSHGADPFAQKIDENGRIVNPVYANQVYSQQFSDKTLENSKILYTFNDFKNLQKAEVIHNTMAFNNELVINLNQDESCKSKKDTIMNKELLEFISSLFGEGMLSLAEGKEKTKEEAVSLIKDLVSSRNSLQEQVNSLTTDKENLETEVANLNAEIDKNKSMVAIGTQHLSDVREKVTNDYRKLMGQDNVDENMITLIASADMSALISLGKSYTTQLEQKFPLKCDECGSHKVSRASSDVNSNKEETSNSAPKSTKDAILNLKNKKR